MLRLADKIKYHNILDYIDQLLTFNHVPTENILDQWCMWYILYTDTFPANGFARTVGGKV